VGRLTTHVLDTAQGIPAAGVRMELRRIVGAERKPVAQFVTNADGRVDGPLLDGDTAGTWEIAFEVEDYFRKQPVAVADPPFLDIVTIRFTIADPDAHYHVPLLVSPWAYSTYRGS
jgi:5-hydroxyisourate hydrolase